LIGNIGIAFIDNILLKLWRERGKAVKQEIGDISLQDIIDFYLEVSVKNDA